MACVGGKSRRGLAFGLALAVVVSAAPAPDTSASPGVDRGKVSAAGPRLVMIRPGSGVGRNLPEGWSDLVIKTLPHIESGDVATLPPSAAATARLFRSVILADVRSAGGKKALRRVGLGLCVPSGGVDTVVDESNATRPPISLSYFESRVLSGAEAELGKTRLVAGSETFAVLASPSELKVGDRHQRVILVYALVLDPGSGALTTYFWSFASKPERRTAPVSLTVLPRGLQFPCELDVEAHKLFGTIPFHWSFAVCSLPTGRALPISPPLRPWATDPNRIASDGEEFERLLRLDASRARGD